MPLDFTPPMNVSIGSKIALIHGGAFFILFFGSIGLLFLSITGYVMIGVFGTIEGVIGLLSTLIPFVFSLFYFGNIMEENIKKKRSLMYTSLTFSFSVNSTIWLTLLFVFSFLLYFTKLLVINNDPDDNFFVLIISTLIAIFNIFIFSLLTSFSIGLWIAYRVKRQLAKVSEI